MRGLRCPGYGYALPALPPKKKQFEAKKGATVVVKTANPYPLANPYTKFRHTGQPQRVELDAWTATQLNANILVEAEL